MKTTLVTLLAAASALVLSLPASASEPSYEPFVSQPSQVSRAAVQATAAQGNAAGVSLASLNADGGSNTLVAVAPSALTRAEVLAQRRDEVRSLTLWPDTLLQQQQAVRMASRAAVIGAAAAAQGR
jgi:hypothetical protein